VKFKFYTYFRLQTLLLFTLLFASIHAQAQIELSNFNKPIRYTAEDGLPSTFTTDIQEDVHGFLWLATGNGVSIFDGSNFINYENYYENSITHKIGFVNALKIDKAGKNVWISTNSGVFHSSIDSVKFERKYGSSTESKRVDDLFFDDKNNVWFASITGLVSHNIDTGENNIFPIGNEFKLNQLQCLAIDSKKPNILWIGTLGGLVRFDLISKEHDVYTFEDQIEMAQNRIRKIVASDEKIFLGTWNASLLIFDKKSQQFTQPIGTSKAKIHKLILSIFKEDNSNNIWVTSAQGLIRYNTKLSKALEIKNHSFNEEIIRGATFKDSRGIMWFGYKHGLFKYNNSTTKNKFLQLEKRSALETPMLVRQIINYPNFMYVGGQYSEGLYKINKRDNTIEIIKTPLLEYSNNGYNIMDMIPMHDQNILIISNRKILIFDTEKKEFKLAPIQIEHPNPSLQVVVKDKNNNYWIGSREGGLFSLNFEKESLKNYTEQFNSYEDGNHRWIHNLYIDTENKLWIGKGTTNAIMDLNDSIITVVKPQSNLKAYKDVEGFYEDNERMWIASASKGLIASDIKKLDYKPKHIIKGGFYKIKKYNDSLLFTISKLGLGELNIKNLSHKPIKLNLDKKTVVRSTIINDNTGNYIIGSTNGIIIYNPKKETVNEEIPQPYIKKIIGNGKVLYKGNDLKNKVLEFDSDINNLNFNISALGFYKSKQITYQYKIKKHWIPLAPNNEINITNLTSGTFTFQLKACNNLDDCNSTSTTYNLIISTPWYRSWWAYCLYGILFCALAIVLYKLYLNRKVAILENQKTTELDTLKTKMYANISHEFKTPLTLINGLSKVLLDENFEDDNIEKIKSINHNGNQLLHLVNQMLELVSFDANKTTVFYKNADIIKFIKQCVSYYKFYSDSKEVTLVFSSKLASLQMDFDDDKLQKILNNLLSNAIKFTPQKGTVTIELTTENKQLILRIIDTGQGIAPEHVPYIFERHYKTFDTENNLGNGIGMALTKELTTILKGTISVESVLKKGSVFTIKLPIENTVKESKAITYQIPFIEKTTRTAEFKEDNTNSTSILLVEDNREIQNFIRLLLGNMYTLHVANNGLEGLEIAKTKSIDFIISDVMMPKMNGFEFCKHIKADIKTSHIPFIIVSAKSGTEDKLKGHQLGIDAYLLKPFNKHELLLIIKNLLLKQQEKVDYFSKLLGLKKQKTEINDINQLDIDFIKTIQEMALSPEKTTIENITEKLAISRSQLHKKIKTLTGQSISHYLNHVRIEKAKVLLQKNKLQISEIAFELGFESPNYFTRIFKKETGKTPNSYRENHLF